MLIGSISGKKRSKCVSTGVEMTWLDKNQSRFNLLACFDFPVTQSVANERIILRCIPNVVTSRENVQVSLATGYSRELKKKKNTTKNLTKMSNFTKGYFSTIFAPIFCQTWSGFAGESKIIITRGEKRKKRERAVQYTEKGLLDRLRRKRGKWGGVGHLTQFCSPFFA